MKLSIVVPLVLAIVACAPPALAPLPLVEGQAAIIEMALTVQIAATMCTANAKHLNGISRERSEALYDRCVNALGPALDAVLYNRDPGCVGKSVRIALERVSTVFVEAGYSGVVPGIEPARRLEAHALPTCDPLHPSSSTTVYVDPNIADVEPDYPPRSPL